MKHNALKSSEFAAYEYTNKITAFLLAKKTVKYATYKYCLSSIVKTQLIRTMGCWCIIFGIKTSKTWFIPNFWIFVMRNYRLSQGTIQNVSTCTRTIPSIFQRNLRFTGRFLWKTLSWWHWWGKRNEMIFFRSCFCTD